MAETLVDRIAQAIGDPGSILPSLTCARCGDPDETLARWGTRAVLTVLAQDLGLPTGPADREAVAGPWQAFIDDGGDAFDNFNEAQMLVSDDIEVKVNVVRDSAMPQGIVAPSRRAIRDVAAEVECWFADLDDELIGAKARHAQARAMAAGLNLAAAIAESLAPAPTVAVHEVPPIGDILTVEPDDATAAKVAATGHLYVAGGVYEMRTIGDQPTSVATLYTIADDTEDDLIDCAKSFADTRGWTVTDYRTEPDRWVLEGARHLNLGG